MKNQYIILKNMQKSEINLMDLIVEYFYFQMKQVRHFQPKRFAGPWYEYERFANDVKDVHQSCNTVFHQPEDDGNLFVVEQYRNTL